MYFFILIFSFPFVIKKGYNYLAFDIIGNLAFGRPFGMLLSGADSAPVVVSSGNGSNTTTSLKTLPAVQILNDRGEYSASMGVLPPSWRPFVRRVLPWYRRGDHAVKSLAGLAIAAVNARLDAEKAKGGEVEDEGRMDLLGKLMTGVDEDGKPMGREELVAEALTQLIAGSDTTSKSVFLYLASCVFFFLYRD
jgi:benzoate 4-monooxygenase